MSHAYAILEISRGALNEIAAKMRAAGYEHAFHDEGDHGVVIDMHGIAVAARRRCHAPHPSVASRTCDRWKGHDGLHREMYGVIGWNDAGEVVGP